MIITVTAPKKGMGQTITAINFAAACKLAMQDNVLLIDINKYCRDIEYFLSDSEITKGLDEFIGLYSAGILNGESFDTCIKKVKGGLDIMAPNDCLEISDRMVENLVKHASSIYETTVIDSIGGVNSYTRLFLKQSDIILVVLNQSRNIVKIASQNNMYKEFNKKIIFVLNRYMTEYEDKKVRYTLQNVEADLQEAGFDCPVFPLSYEADIINECNDYSVLNLILSSRANSYNEQLNRLVGHITGNSPEAARGKKIMKTVPVRKNRLFGLI